MTHSALPTNESEPDASWSRLAVVLFNLGGPDRPEAIPKFLFNLFNDPAIIGAPGPIRWSLAKYISRKRTPTAREIYQHLGGKSPLLDLTRAQAEALETALNEDYRQSTDGISRAVKTFVTMRYWHPLADETVAKVKAFDPDLVVLLPLYPQYSTTTSRSSIRDWKRAATAAGLRARMAEICCFPTDGAFAAAHTTLIQKEIQRLPEGTPFRVIFSAHGLPVSIIEKGDPYQWQVEQTAEAVVEGLGREGLDWTVAYQSRVTPVEWIGPSTEDEIARAGRDGKSIILVPIAFVSEHSETLVELDIEYRALAEKAGVKTYLRVPALGTEANFVESLKRLVVGIAAPRSPALQSGSGGRLCPSTFSQCPIREEIEGEDRGG